jgi:hypothetical protein
MPRIRKWRRGLCSLCILTSLSAIAVSADDAVPSGYKPDRYQGVWERNPFTLVTPPAQEVRTTPFDKLILVSWLNDGGKDVAFIQNTETSEVQKVTNDPNANNLRLVAVHRSADPQKADVVLSNGAEQGSVKFRLEIPAGVPQVDAGQQPVGIAAGVQTKIPAVATGAPVQAVPRMSRQMQLQQNAQHALQQAARVGAAQLQPGAAQLPPGAAQLPPGAAQFQPGATQLQPGAAQLQPGAAQLPPGAAQFQPGAETTQPDDGTMPPRAAEVRRKRITPPPSVEQPVGAPAPYQNPSNQAQPQ